MDKWYIPVTFLPGIGLLILSTSNIILALSNELNDFLTKETYVKHIHAQKIKQLRLLTWALTGFYITAAAFVVSGGLGFLLESKNAQIPRYALYLGVLCTFIALTLLIVYAYRGVSIRKQQFDNLENN